MKESAQTDMSKFVEEDWQRHDIIKLLMRHDNQSVERVPNAPKSDLERGIHDPMTGKKVSYAGTANWSEMGCVAGSTSINLNRAKKGFMTTIEKAYKAFNGLNNHPRANYDRSKETYAQAYVNGRIRQHRVLAILDKGIKEVVKVTLEDGRSLTCTPDHKIALIDGSWVEAGKLTDNNYVLIRGSFGGRNVTVEVPNMVTNRSLGDGRFIDKDGYVRVPDHNHPRRNASNHVYEHILIMEKHLERNVSKHEHVHHINKNRSDNRIQNLELHSPYEHKSLHAKAFLGTYGIWGNRVKSVESAGTDHVYDLVMDEPFHNFVANGIVVHNCYKTSTGLWFIKRKLQEAMATSELTHAPSFLIVTNKSGKGTFFEAVPELFPDWMFINIETNALEINVNGTWLKIPPSKMKFLPKEFAQPTVAITHYNVFSNSVMGQFEEDENGKPVRDENGKFVMKEWRQADYVIDHLWDFVWCDEFHRMKDKDTKWTVNIKKIKTTVGRHGSTGTGFINRPNEIWSLLNWLDKHKYPSYGAFHEAYCDIDVNDGYSRVVGVKPEKRTEFRKLVRDIGVRRTLDQTHPDIEKPVFTALDVELNKEQRKMYDQIKGELRTLDKNGVELFSANVLSLLQRLRQICVGTPEVISDVYDPILDRRIQKIKLREPSSKLDAVMEVLESLQWDDEKKEPLVVFSCFKDPLELLKARLNKHNEFIISSGLDQSMLYSYIHLEQEDDDQVRYEKWHDEFPKMEHRIFMSTLQLGGESINLTPSHHLIFLDRSWSPKDNNQGIGRIRRPGQTSVPHVININALRTTDQYIEDVVNIKQGWYNQIFGDE